MTLYNLRSALDDFRITKFTKDLDVESSYLISDGSTGPVECECPAGSRSTCRHRQMLPDLIPIVDTAFFWDFDKHMYTDSDGAQVTLDEIADPAGVDSTEPATLATENAETLSPSPAQRAMDAVYPPASNWRRI